MGPLLLLVALLIVMALAAVALKQYGLPTGAARPTLPHDAGAAPAEGEAPPPVQALERARGLQDTVRQQAEEMQRRIDSAEQ